MKQPEQSEVSSQAYQALSKYFAFTSVDHQEWWEHSAPMFSKLLFDAEYDVYEQIQHLYLFGAHIIPMLGPFPISRPGSYKCVLGSLGPLEFSQNFTKSKATIRFAIEPTGAAAGTPKDPCNRFMINDALTRLKNLCPQTDLQLYHRLAPRLTLTDDEEALMVSGNKLAALPCRTQTILALDLKGSDASVKLYLYASLKSIATGTPTKKLLMDSVRTIDADHGGIFSEGLAKVEAYMKSAPPTVDTTFLSCDLVAPGATRFKIYFFDLQVDWRRISDIWTLGGALHDEETLTGLDMLKDLWDILQVPEGTRPMPDRPTLPGDPPNRLPLMFNLEIQPNKPWPQVKMYFALTGINDKALAEALSGQFSEWGWSELAENLVQNTASHMPGQNLSESTDFYAWLSFSYSAKTGPYVTVYYH